KKEVRHDDRSFKNRLQGQSVGILSASGNYRHPSGGDRSWQAGIGSPAISPGKTRSARRAARIGDQICKADPAGWRRRLGSAPVIVLDTHALIWWANGQ